MADDLLHALNGRLLLVRIGTDDVASPGVFRRILVGLDGSEGAERALDGARALARRGKSTLVLARVLSPMVGTYNLGLADVLTLIDDAATQSAVDDANQYLDDIAEAIRREDGLDVETVVEIASGVSPRSAAARQLARISRDRRIDLVSLTTRKRGSSRLLLRSVADRVLRDTHCALLLCDGRPATVVTGPSRHEPAAVTIV
ncbi:MAG TPA: universal stress protein [Gemmatimonadales bacterium]